MYRSYDYGMIVPNLVTNNLRWCLQHCCLSSFQDLRSKVKTQDPLQMRGKQSWIPHHRQQAKRGRRRQVVVILYFITSCDIMTANNNNNSCKEVLCSKLPPTFNIPWVIATTLCIWFLFIHAPIAISDKDYFKPRLLWVHLFGVYAIYLICAHNTIFTPSTRNGAARPYHIWAGRIGLILGVVGFISGLALTWYLMDPMEDLGFSIGITYGGIAQIRAQFMGYRSIKQFQQIKARIEAKEYQTNQPEELIKLKDEQDEQLQMHIASMINLFVLACGIPGLIRLVKLSLILLLPAIVGMKYLSVFMARSFVEKIKTKRESGRGLLGMSAKILYQCVGISFSLRVIFLFLIMMA